MPAIVQTAAPAIEPVTLAEAKAHCRIDVTADDDYVSALITAARQWCEKRLGQSFITQTWRLSLDRFPPHCFELPYSPLLAVSSVTYYDEGNALQTLSTSLYEVDANSRPGRLAPVWGESWPSTYERMNAVAVTYTAGYGSAASDVPAGVKHAIKLLVGHWYENREASTDAESKDIPHGVESLLVPCWHGACAIAGVFE